MVVSVTPRKEPFDRFPTTGSLYIRNLTLFWFPQFGSPRPPPNWDAPKGGHSHTRPVRRGKGKVFVYMTGQVPPLKREPEPVKMKGGLYGS